MIKPDTVIIHYDEIGLKGNNRHHFEELLIYNIRLKLRKELGQWLREAGQISFPINDPESADTDKIAQTLACVPGIAYFSLARRTARDVETLALESVEFLRGREFHTFKVDTKRHEKNVPYTSVQLNALLGEKILGAYPDKKVRLTDPDLTLKVEITHKHAYLSAGNFAGTGGFPTDPRQKVVALLSGGFDSPVASYLMMKRGCEVVFAHFLNENRATAEVEDKVISLARRLACFQRTTRLHLVPFGRVQNEIIMKVPAPARMIVYRKFMLHIAARLAAQVQAPFLVVGDSLSQVASQTIDNLQALYTDAELHVLSPLIGFDKKEIITVARRIGTFDLSSRDCPDVCSYYVPKHPLLRATSMMLAQIEADFDVPGLSAAALESARVLTFPEKPPRPERDPEGGAPENVVE